MELLRGTVTAFHHSVMWSRQSDGRQTVAMHIGDFHLQARAVRVLASASIEISNGDEVVVAGRMYHDLSDGSDRFDCMAHINLTTGVCWNNGWKSRAIQSALVTTMGLVFLWCCAQMNIQAAIDVRFIGFMVAAIIMLVIGTGLAWRGLRVFQAVRLLREFSATRRRP